MLAWLKIHKTDMLLIGRRTPLAFTYLISIYNIEMVSHVDTLEKQVERALTVRKA